MSDVIKLLPDSVANQIAAGEVIQRPASVIKELVENAIDAKATNIQIVLKDAGRTLIQVIDNGMGMSETDARLAFERHSTSKISNAQDLFSLTTMGFRGEALASIAAIAQVELRTCMRGEQLGTKLLINASVCEKQEVIACPAGCNFIIRNIFFNVPARRKFLKSNQVELSNIVKEFEKLALINHNVEFSLTHNDKLMYKLLPGGFKQRIVALMGHAFDTQLVPLSVETSLVKIDGFVCRPENARKRNLLQYMFVNGRYMRHPYFNKAVLSSYEELIPDDEQPNYFLRFTVDPNTIDVNIHPTKQEIKFENEIPIWQILAAAVKESLGRFSAVPSIEFDNEGAPEIPVYDNRKPTEAPPMGINPSYNPFNTGRKQSYTNPANNWQELYKNFESGMDENTPLELLPEEGIKTVPPASQGEILPGNAGNAMCIQMKERYILTPIKSGLMVVDQHRAHELIIFTRYMSQIDGNNLASQSILFPEVIHLSPSQNIILTELEPEMEKIGFGLSNLGGNDWAVNSIPAGIDNVDVKDMLLKVIDSIVNGGEALSQAVYRKVAISVARSAAIPYGRVLKNEEMDKLISDLLQIPNPNYTADGKTVMYVIPIEQITRYFN